MKFYALLLSLFILLTKVAYSQQVADPTGYNPPIHKPEYAIGQGPIIFIDKAHNNFHTREGRYRSFARLLERDGYILKDYDGPFEKSKLNDGRILVISNALHESNISNWVLPNPSAFTADEIEVVREWVFEGGSLFLIADHMPMPGAAEDLAATFGFEFYNGFAFTESPTGVTGLASFSTEKGNLHENTITSGRNEHELVTEIMSFTGQAFQIPNDAQSIIDLDNQYIMLLPDTAWRFNSNTKQISVGGWSQGAYKSYGKGKVVVFGEAAMFSAQVSGPNQRKMGMNAENATQNYKLLLNIIHWLDGKLN